jgi:His/Glu/Gln/Arg/opine family amino acid ABC transporter permease subunit
MQFQLYSGFQWTDIYYVLQGVGTTILLTLLSVACGTILGVALGWLRHVLKAASILFAVYMDVTRSVPLIIQLILLNSFLSLAGYPLPGLLVGVIVLSLYMSVLTAELLRAGLLSVRTEMTKAGRSLGMGYWQELIHVTGPLAIRTILPAWIGTAIGLAKDTALVSVVGCVELLRVSQVLISRTNEALLVLLGTGAFYFLICYPVSRYGRRLEMRLQHD